MSTFDSANMAIVAYAEVSSDGTSASCNSGIGTTRTSAGRYALILPPGLTQYGAQDLIHIQVKKSSTTLSFDGLVKSAVVNDALPNLKTIEISGVSGTPLVSTAINHDFSVLILRTQIAPPTGSPA